VRKRNLVIKLELPVEVSKMTTEKDPTKATLDEADDPPEGPMEGTRTAFCCCGIPMLVAFLIGLMFVPLLSIE